MNNTEQTNQTSSDIRTREQPAESTARVAHVAHADPGGLFARAKHDPKFVVRSLDAGPERVILVLAQALRATVYREGYAPEDRKTYPAMVVRERPASEIGKPDNESDWTVLGIYRHVQVLDGGTFEFVANGQRLKRLNGDEASLVMRTTGAVRTFEHADDEKVKEGDYISC